MTIIMYYIKLSGENVSPSADVTVSSSSCRNKRTTDVLHQLMVRANKTLSDTVSC